MPHPLTARLATQMWTADGRPSRDAAGRPVTVDTYEAWADMALQSLDGMFPGQLSALAATGELDPHAGRPDWPTLPVSMCHEAGHVLGVGDGLPSSPAEQYRGPVDLGLGRS